MTVKPIVSIPRNDAISAIVSHLGSDVDMAREIISRLGVGYLEDLLDTVRAKSSLLASYEGAGSFLIEE